MKRELLFSTPRFDVCMSTVRIRTRNRRYYYVVKPDAVLVIPYTNEGILLLKVTRPLLDRPSFELPGGRVENGETPLAAAQRELAEECALESQNWRHHVTSFPLPSVTTERVHIFSAKVRVVKKPGLRKRSGAEGIRSMVIRGYDEVRTLALCGDMRCAVDAYAALVFLSGNHMKEGKAHGR